MSAKRVSGAAGKAIRGFVEVRGPERLAGWAWRVDSDIPVTLVFWLGGQMLGETSAAARRADLKAAGVGGGQAGFSWRIPTAYPPHDPADVRVVDKATGAELADSPAVVLSRPRRTAGAVEVRGPEVMAGWATGWGEPRRLRFMRGETLLGETVADRPRGGLRKVGVADGRAGFEWRLPYLDPPLDPATVEVRDAATGEIIPDTGGVQAITPPLVRGWVEQRGPELISGWAKGPHGPAALHFVRGEEVLGTCLADEPRPGLATADGDDRAAFHWRLPFTDPPVDPATVEVRAADGAVILPDAPELESVKPGLVRGVVEARGPRVISGWAKGADGPLTLVLLRDGEEIATVVADRLRPGLTFSGQDEDRIGFEWRLPLLDPPFDPARIEVRDVRSATTIADAPGLAAVTPAVVRGWIEQHGPDVISGWARGPEGPVTLQILRGQEVLAEFLADGVRESLREEGVPDGRAAFHWSLPFGDPSYDARRMRVVDVRYGVELPDAVGLEPRGRPVVCGVVESCSYRLVAGWAYGGRPGERTELHMVCDGEVVGRCVADIDRPDLAASGLDDGRHVFSWTPPRRLKAFDAARLQVVAQPSGVILPKVFRAAKPTGLEVADLSVEASWLHGRLRRTGEIAPPASVDIVSDGLYLHNARIDALDYGDDGWADLLVELPRKINDGQPHRITLHDQREGDLLGGQGEGLDFQCGANGVVELVTPLEIRGWVIGADDPDGEGTVDLYDGDRLLRRHRLGRARPEVAKAFDAGHAWEFLIRRLPLALFDGEPHALRLLYRGQALSAHGGPRIEVSWSGDQSASDAERFSGAVQEIDASGVRGFAIDHLHDAPVRLDILVDGEVVAETLANRYVAALKAEMGHGFHGFAWRFPSNLMNGRKRRVAVRLSGRSLLLAPKTRPVLFPLTALDQEAPPTELAPPVLDLPAPDDVQPALLSLIVLNLNGAHVLEPCLRSLGETRFRDRIEIILIDHGSTDESRAIIEAWRGRLALTPLYRGVNHSFSASCNLGAALAKGRHLVMVNNDIVFTGDCLAAMRDLLDADPEVGLVGLRLLEPRYRGEGLWEQVVHHTGVRFAALAPQHKGEPRIYHPVEVEEGGDTGAVIEPAVTAALAMVRWQDFRALGGFDEGYVYGYEDVDFALRMRATLGKLAVCRLGDSAVHNRSATRESKLVASEPQGEAPAATGEGRSPRANLDRFVQRFARHLPRVILGQLVTGGEAWRAEPLRVAFVVAEPERGPDTEAARALGKAMRNRFGWEPMLIGEDGHDLAMSDVLVSLRPGYELRRLAEGAPGLITVAWDWNGSDAWEGRAEPYHLHWTLPPGTAAAAAAARGALAHFLEGRCARIAIKAQAENEPQARALAQALEARGQHVRIDGPRHWACGLSACDEIVLAMAGVRAYAPFAGVVNALCLAPGAEAPTAEALAAFDHVFAPGDPDVDAEVLLGLYDRLRRRFLGKLAR